MKDLGIAQRFVGIGIKREDGITSISQKGYINTVIKRFSMGDARDISSPMGPDVDIGNPLCQDKTASKDLYMSLIGSLMLATRPDITCAVTVLSRYNKIPLQMRLTAAKRVLRYLKTTVGFEVHLGSEKLRTGQPLTTLEGFTDSDWAGFKDNRKSMGGYIFFSHGGAILWQAKGQTVVAISTLEAEYIACSDATRETFRPMDAVQIGSDNQRAIKLMNSEVVRSKTKHIHIRCHHTHDEQKQGRIGIGYVGSKEGPADLSTKNLNTPRHMELVRMIGLKERGGVWKEKTDCVVRLYGYS